VIEDVAARYARLTQLWRQARRGAATPHASSRPIAAKDTA
jgi:hypothetical protein